MRVQIFRRSVEVERLCGDDFQVEIRPIQFRSAAVDDGSPIEPVLNPPALKPVLKLPYTMVSSVR